MAENEFSGGRGAPICSFAARAQAAALRAKAKRVIYLFMAGGPSQLELFDHKPKLQELDGQIVPPSYTKNKRFAFIKARRQAAGHAPQVPARTASRGAELSELLPHLARSSTTSAMVRSMATDVFNHGPAKLFVNTGSLAFRPAQHGRLDHLRHRQRVAEPAGLRRAAVGPAWAARRRPLWGSGFLPTAYQGVPFLTGAEPILNLSNPQGIDAARQAEFFAAVHDLNAERLGRGRRSGNRDSHCRLRNGLSHADRARRS